MAQFCGACGSQNFGTPFCESCGNRVEGGGTFAAPQQVPGSPLYVGVLIAYIVSLILFQIVSPFFYGIASSVLKWLPAAAIVVAGVLAAVAGARSPVPSRRPGSIVLGIAAVPLYLVGTEMVWTDVGAIILAIVPVFLFLSWAVGRPLRGLSYVALPIGLVLALLAYVALILFSNVAWQLGAFYIVIAALVDIAVVVGVVLIALAFDKVSRNSAARKAMYASVPVSPYVAAAQAPGALSPANPYQSASAPYGTSAPANQVAPIAYHAAPLPSTNGFAIAALVIGILGGSVLGIIFGHIALSQIARTGQAGRGMALTGLILSYFWLAVMIIIYVVLFAQMSRYW